MKQYLDQKGLAWREHAAQFECAHENTALRRRPIKGGAIQYVRQCLKCGESQNQPLSKAKAFEENGGIEPQVFDDTLKQHWEQRRIDSIEST